MCSPKCWMEELKMTFMRMLEEKFSSPSTQKVTVQKMDLFFFFPTRKWYLTNRA